MKATLLFLIFLRFIVTGEDDYHFAIQELEDVLLNQDSPRLSDAMNELSDVMEKMTRFTEEMSLEDN